MLETNVRIVRPGLQLYINVRRVTVEGQNLDPDLLEHVCSVLRRRYGLAAAREPGSKQCLLVASDHPVPSVVLQEEHWEIRAKDASEPSQRLYLHDLSSESLVTTLIERALLAEVAQRSHLWTLDSPRIWYETQPFCCEDGIAAYRRYEVAAVFIEEVGIGVVADLSTAFFAEQALAYFFDAAIAHEERQVRETHFTMLTGRQQGQKGTLLYDNGSSKISCYFDEAPPGLTCGSTGPLTVKGKRYSSVSHYYREQYPALNIEESMPAVRVSFRGLDRPQPVAAHLVRPRVMNENVPESLSSVDKIEPARRRRLLMQFWNALEPHLLRQVALGLMPGFWRPDAARVYYFMPPAVEFADGHRIR